jgi:hypothetical protein
LQINIRVDEHDASRQRLRVLSQDLYTSLDRTRMLDIRFVETSAERDDKDAKAIAEFIPGLLAISLGATTSIARLSRILEAWITRDRYRTVRLENPKTGEVLDIKGLPVEQIIQIMERWTSEDDNNG